MSEIDDKLTEISDKINEHIMTVKGTLELVDASVSEEDLHNLLLKAVDRMDDMQKLSAELFEALRQIIAKVGETKDQKIDEG
jgi:hypothetical protein